MIALFTIALAIAATDSRCVTVGSPEAQAVREVDLSDPVLARGLAEATSPAVVEMARKASGCSRGSGMSGAISGENGDPLPRVFRWDGRVRYLYPVRFDGRTAYALVQLWPSGAVRLDMLLDAIPDDVRLMSMRWSLRGGYEPLGFDEDAGRLVDPNNYVADQLEAGAEAYEAGR